MKFIKQNGLSLTFLALFAVCMAGQIFFGFAEHNKELQELNASSISLISYFSSGHFIEATFENWESEFLQMALFVLLSIFLYQKGSSESKDFDANEDVNREPDPNRKGVPWPVQKGGIVLAIYKHSLTTSLLLFFLLAFVAHFYGSLKDVNEENLLNLKPTVSADEYFSDSRFWFESLQNWQSEFLSVFVLVILSIYLRQKGSPQSKPVDAPNEETGG